MVNGADNITFAGLNVTFAPMFAGGHYRMSYFYNELVLFGCQVLATLVAGNIRFVRDGGNPKVAGCASFCSGGRSYPRQGSDSTASDAEEGWLDMEDWKKNQQPEDEPKNDIPLILRWDIMQGVALADSEKHDPYILMGTKRPRDVASLCKSNNSRCSWDVEVFMCECNMGYDGNPYVAGGCRDIDECKHQQDNGCFGECTNTEGWFECRCPCGTYGNPTVRGGCVNSSAGQPSFACF
ncbi:hypothetical protein EJB05_44006, partial [Eragrostis curvula]